MFEDNKVLFVLSFFTLVFAGIVLAIAWLRPDDGGTYQTFVGMMASFGGALLLRLNPNPKQLPGTTTTTPPKEIKPDAA